MKRPVPAMPNSSPIRALVMGVDPGPEESSYVVWDGKAIVDKFSGTNGDLLWLLRSSGRLPTGMEAVVFEQVESYGMAVGREVFETVFETGRLYQQADRAQHNVVLMPRKEVKIHPVRLVARQGFKRPLGHPGQNGRQARGGRAEEDPRTAVWDQVAPMVGAGDSDHVVRQEHRQGVDRP